MAARIVGYSVLVLGCSLYMACASTSVAETSQQAAIATEPSGPKPSAAVQRILGEARRLAEAQQPLDSLKAADQALELARQTNDTTGAALAEEARAKALQHLERTDESVAAWQQAAQIWSGVGDAPGQITALVQTGLLCVSDKKSEAQKFFAEALLIGKSEGPRPLAVAQALEDSGVALDQKGEREEAFNYLAAVLTLRESQTPDSLAVVETLNALANVALNRAIDGNDEKLYSLAEGYSARAGEMGKRVAPDSSALVQSLYFLCFAEDVLDNDNSAKEHCLEALRIQKNLAPARSMTQARILSTLGRIEIHQTHFALAHEYLDEALAIGESLAPESGDYLQVLNRLSALETFEGNLQAARNHLLRALALEEKLHGWLAPIYLNLGVIATEQDDFVKAREYTEKALALFLETKPNNVGVRFALGNLGLIAYRQGDLVSALEYASRVIAIDERRSHELENPEDYNAMGDILLDQGNLVSAAQYYQRALDIQEKIAPESLNVSYSLVNLAKVARAQGNLRLAMEYDHRALELGEKSCPNYWCVTQALNNLGQLAYQQGDLTTSESYLRRAVDAREQSLGPVHSDLARSLNDLALTLAAMGKTEEALRTALRAESIGAEHLRLSARTLSERQALAYEGIRASGLDVALSLTADRTNAPLARSEVFDAVIRSRALVFDELAARHRSAYGSGDPEVTQLSIQLSSARTQLATLLFRGVGDTTPEAYRKLLGDTREKKEKAERMLAERSLAFRQDQARAQLGLKEIVTSVPQDAALVSFVRYARHDLQKPRTSNVVPAPVASYAAFVLRAGEDEPEFVPLGTAREIESLVAAWRREITRQTEVMDISGKTGENTYRHSGAALRRRIWDPLVPALGNVKVVLVVPDATLHLVSLASLPVGSSHYLLETGPLIHYLSTERDLVPAQSRRGEGILVVGNPAFDQAGKLVVASNTQSAAGAATGKEGTILSGTRSACGTFQTLRFSPLPASQQEAENIAALWKRSIWSEGTVQSSGEPLQMTGANASTEAFEQYAPGKRVLHVATHGFFLEGSCESVMQRRLDAKRRDESSLPATGENPLLLSGLAFAGANRRGSAKRDETDGILTAEEIAGINLEGVDWAVLSACDTGVGEIKVGEGVFGLRRAFQVAGAKTVIMSLWSVEDETTRQWMGTLYREHFLNGKDTGESVRAASLQVLRQRRAKHQSTHPFYWGAFIAAGDWH